MQPIPRSFSNSAGSGRRGLRSIVLGFALTLTLVLGVAGSASSQEPDPTDAQGPSGAGLPFKAVFSAKSTVEQDPSRCPGGLKVSVRGSGLATQLGKFTALQTHCLNPAHDPFGFTNGIYEFTAEDGSTIRGQYGGRIIPTPTSDVDAQFYVDAAFSITRGTGRLTGVRGGGSASGLLTPSTGDAAVVLDGNIRLPRR
jgi:hypothetical protein